VKWRARQRHIVERGVAKVPQTVPENLKAGVDIEAEASLRGHLKADERDWSSNIYLAFFVLILGAGIVAFNPRKAKPE
jgi:hypothetical protein